METLCLLRVLLTSCRQLRFYRVGMDTGQCHAWVGSRRLFESCLADVGQQGRGAKSPCQPLHPTAGLT